MPKLTKIYIFNNIMIDNGCKYVPIPNKYNTIHDYLCINARLLYLITTGLQLVNSFGFKISSLIV